MNRETPHGLTTDSPSTVRSNKPSAWRWGIVVVFGFSSALNYLDRQLLAAVAPTLKLEFQLSNAQYGALISAFSLAYMLTTPLAGLFIDRVGLRIGATVAVTAWSVVGALTSLVRGLPGLLAIRMLLGVSESAGIPSSSKASATYLKPAEFGLGNAVQSLDIALGAIAAPILAAALMPLYGWRGTFFICGIGGLLWVPLWWITSGRISAAPPEPKSTPPIAEVALDRRLWFIILSSSLIMTVHSLWMNWTTLYLVEQYSLTQTEANRYFAWIPPIFASLGGLTGGFLGLWQVRRSNTAIVGRLRACRSAAPVLLVTAFIPLLHSAELAIVGICVSFFGAMMILINLHVIPLDLFGVRRTAFASALLASSYALMQAILAPTIGAVIDSFGFTLVCILICAVSLAGVLILPLVAHKPQHTE